MEKKKSWLRNIITFLIIIAVLFLLQRLLTPKYVEDIVEGGFVKEYYEEERKDFDVLFIGDCEVYENFSPVKLWQEYGISSYIRGSAEQYIWQSYYMLEDSLRYATPKVVIFNVQALQFNESNSEAYNRMTLEGMKWSSSKVKAIQASMKKDEKFIEYVFPLLRYHSRWKELTMEDIKYMFKKEKVSHNGYYMRVDIRPVQTIPDARILSDYSFGDNAWKYLEKMTALCEEKGIELVLIKAPSLYPHWYQEWDQQIVDYAKKHELTYINFLELVDEIGIDYSKDTYDAGLHMNLTGAEKLSDYLGERLAKEFKMEDRREDKEWSMIWDKKIMEYEVERDAQYEYYGMK